VESGEQLVASAMMPALSEEAIPDRPEAPSAEPALPVSVSHVADFYRRYPGETFKLHTRVDVHAHIPGLSVQISLPTSTDTGSYRASAAHGDALPDLVLADDSRYIIWTVERHLEPGDRFDYEVELTVQPTQQNLMLRSVALARPGGMLADSARVSETVDVAVFAKGRYLQFLPRLYQEQDELMGRYLMLFESFWGPVEAQIDSLHHYFDPELTPAELLPWLASWIDLTLDERWPEDKRRRLLRSAVSLYRRRGTRRGLREYLEIYTGAQVQITEHGAHNFRLGPEARLGLGVALGTLNLPHTFTVTVFLPAEDEPVDSAQERERRDAARRRMIETIIEAEKPAHTSYHLRVEVV
jgi:phage tail-like protein